jgi:glycosyltransferase involved in cell wall biosynthesis
MSARTGSRNPNDPYISIIIPTRNRLSYLRDAMQSALIQVDASFEVVVVDDASSDGTGKWLKGIQHDGVRPIVLDSNVGRAAARNQGLHAARGESVLFLDDDDRLRPAALEKLAAALMRERDAVAAAGARLLFNDQGQRRRVRHPRWRLKRIVWTDAILDWLALPGQVLWRTEAIREAGGWNEQLPPGQPEDRELLVRACIERPMVIIPAVVLETRIHAAQWKARDSLALRERWTTQFVESLPPRRRETGVRALEAYSILKAAGEAYGAFHHREALVLYRRAWRAAPKELSSPLLWHRTIPPMVKSVIGIIVGHDLMRRARSTKRLVQPIVRRALRKDVQRKKHVVDIQRDPRSVIY